MTADQQGSLFMFDGEGGDAVSFKIAGSGFDPEFQPTEEKRWHEAGFAIVRYTVKPTVAMKEAAADNLTVRIVEQQLEVTEFYDIDDVGLAKELIVAGRERSATAVGERMRLTPRPEAVAS